MLRVNCSEAEASLIRSDFEAFWRADKSIVEEIRFTPSKQCEGVFEFERVQLLVPVPSDYLVHGSYSCLTGAVTYHFWIEGLGPVVRYCMGGPEHGGAGRFHRHCMRNLQDIRRNLPYAESRAEMTGWSARQIWEQICSEGNITHSERFYEPEYLCE